MLLLTIGEEQGAEFFGLKIQTLTKYLFTGLDPSFLRFEASCR
jgi:hypothetical protein